MIKTPIGLVTLTLSAAILLAASLLIVTGTRSKSLEPPAPIPAPMTK